MAENCDRCGNDVKLLYEKSIRRVGNKMLCHLCVLQLDFTKCGMCGKSFLYEETRKVQTKRDGTLHAVHILDCNSTMVV